MTKPAHDGTSVVPLLKGGDEVVGRVVVDEDVVDMSNFDVVDHRLELIELVDVVDVVVVEVDVFVNMLLVSFNASRRPSLGPYGF